MERFDLGFSQGVQSLVTVKPQKLQLRDEGGLVVSDECLLDTFEEGGQIPGRDFTIGSGARCGLPEADKVVPQLDE